MTEKIVDSKTVEATLRGYTLSTVANTTVFTAIGTMETRIKGA